MRLLLAGTAAAVFAFAATPAFAQYGGSPDQQADGAPAPNAAQPAPDDEDADQAALPSDDQNTAVPDEGGAEDLAGGKPGMDEAGPAEDSQADVDTDQGADQGDVDADQGAAEADQNADAYAGGGNAGTDVDQGTGDVDQDADADADQGDTDMDDSGDYEDEDQAEPGAPGSQTAG